MTTFFYVFAWVIGVIGFTVMLNIVFDAWRGR
jgi:hypothetical protein